MFGFLYPRPKHPKHPPLSPDISASETLLPASPTLKPTPSTHPLRIATKTLILCSIIYLSAGLWVGLRARSTTCVNSPDVDELCMRHVSVYSPIVRDVPPGWHTQRFNGTFLHENAYRGAAGPGVDAAWGALGVDYRSVVIPESEAEKTGLRGDQVKISREYGGGFPANVEGLHHLHCLDLLRKTLHWNYDYYLARKEGPFVNSEYIVRIHTTHCLDMLRQVLMCNPDVGVLGQVWWKPEGEADPMPFVDFNTRHRCRDFEGVRAWAEAHQLRPETEVDMGRFYEMPKPGDTVYSAIP
ncbi:hypothetical protein P153DRAFT_341721 [Dothidotthia symphoricarpi CBS 119687]|uniref:Tat pathway signal sequence n=1 Tax=Dothidotthia symphoricarpi CBS 119687 TaxID=1392245 RepID=A0A6A6AB49_9PLEO|nr:uncharacterized protein P153DRAFT_341721 [Dothidotthia symphoricarpi CBS 119687]KAF2129162.1 hypothetical protein P153DRAFT_341721 [Dothidotthia symphoricarpi CBS 119687]